MRVEWRVGVDGKIKKRLFCQIFVVKWVTSVLWLQPSCIPGLDTRYTALGLLSKESAAGWGHSAHNNICSLDKILKRVSQCGKQIFTLLCLSYFIPRFSSIYLLCCCQARPLMPDHYIRPGLASQITTMAAAAICTLASNTSPVIRIWPKKSFSDFLLI